MYAFLAESSRTNWKDYSDQGLSQLIIPKSNLATYAPASSVACITGVRSTEISRCLHPVKRRFIAIDDMQADEPIRQDGRRARRKLINPGQVQGLSENTPSLSLEFLSIMPQSLVWRLTVLSKVKRLTWHPQFPPSNFPKPRSVLTEKSKPTPSVDNK